MLRNGANWCSYGWSDGQLALILKDFWAKLQSDPEKMNVENLSKWIFLAIKRILFLVLQLLWY